MTVMLSSQGIGLITVIAVSGCSVMLLVLGRQKLLELRKDSAEDSKDGLGSLCSDAFKSLSVVEHGVSSPNQCRGSISWRINLHMSEASVISEYCCQKMPKSAVKASQDKKRNLVKKVRFSEDVVEPSGNNAEYRRRHAVASASRSGQLRSQNTENMASKPLKRIEGSRQRNLVNQECKMQTLAKPDMPANRMALYNGIFHDKSQRALLY